MKPNFRCVIIVVVLLVACLNLAHAEGEAVGGFPNWNERVFLEWLNRARSDPQVEMTGCGSRCGDATCYAPIAPLGVDHSLIQAARFHSENMLKMNYVSHTSACTLVSNIATLYPTSCDAGASCSCVGGVAACSGSCTDFAARIGLFGGSASGEVITEGNDPDAAFYVALYENYPNTMQPPNCGFDFGTPTNGDRRSMLTNPGVAGAGQTDAVTFAVLDFGFGSDPTPKIPSASHYPRQAASVDAWANWFDTAGPSVHKIDVDGVCSDMTLTRGSQTNGAWHSTVNGVGSGCHRYVFAFKDGSGNEVLYPGNGSLTIGNGSAQCPDWSSIAPTGCAGFDRIFADGFEP